MTTLRAPVHWLIALAVFVAIGIAVRIVFLNSQSLWADEIVSVSIAQLRWPEFLHTLTHGETNMALYYLLLRFWLTMGRSEVVIRGLSVLFSVATIPVVYGLGARLFGRRAGLVAALLLALNAFHIRYAQEARSYSLVVFLLSVASLYYVDAVETSSRRSWIAYSTTMTLSLYSHVFAVFVLVAHGCALVFLPSRSRALRGMAASASVISLLVLPFALYLLAGDQGQTSWIAKAPLSRIPGLVAQLIGVNEALPAWTRRLPLVPYLPLAVAGVALATGAWKIQLRSETSWQYGVIVAWFAVPIILAFAVSAVKPIFVVHYLIVSLPPLILLIAAAASKINGRMVFAGTLIALILGAAAMIAAYYKHAEKEDWRAATHYVVSQARPGDTVIFYSVGKNAFDYYRDRESMSSPSVTEYAPPWDAAILFARHMYSVEAMPLRAGSRAWRVLNNDETVFHTSSGEIDRAALRETIQQYLARERAVAASAAFRGGIRVLLYRMKQ
jgi:mannosyltransferase